MIFYYFPHYNDTILIFSSTLQLKGIFHKSRFWFLRQCLLEWGM
jgi:hypothetical protein